MKEEDDQDREKDDKDDKDEEDFPSSKKEGEEEESEDENEEGKEEKKKEKKAVPQSFPSNSSYEAENMRALLAQMTDGQQSRYEYYRRSGFQRPNVKRLMHSIANCPISNTMAIVMAGVSKVFVGEIVETSRSVMDEWGETGPIRPRHIREAHRRIKRVQTKPKGFLRKLVY